MKEEIRIKDIVIKDYWLWSQVKIVKENCPECGLADSVTINKGKDLTKLIKVLQKLNYKGIKGKLK
jgi:hypothetical protein